MTAQAEPETPNAGPSLAVACLDDDADFREYLTGLLVDAGHAAHAFASAEALFTWCERSTPDVVLLDMNMGRESGQRVLDDLRVRWPRLCVVVVTGYPSLDTMRETFKRQVYDYLAKPFETDELLDVLRQAAEELGLGKRPQDLLRASLGRQVRLARTEQQWTLKELSERSGLSVSQLSSIERGAHLPSLESLVAVAGALDRTPSEWLGEAGF